jgi:hypothetical protein
MLALSIPGGAVPKRTTAIVTQRLQRDNWRRFVLGKVIQASGHIRVWPVPKVGECGAETEAERKQRKAWAQFVKPFLREQFVSSTDNNTANRIIETYYLLWLRFDTKGEVPLRRAAAAVIDGMMGDYDEINSIAGAFISSKEEFDAYIKGLRKQSYDKLGRPLNSSDIARNPKELWMVGNKILTDKPVLKHSQGTLPENISKFDGELVGMEAFIVTLEVS